MIGQTISHYRITEKLGEGGMGVVYKAEDLKLGRAVALKFLPAHLLESKEHRARFLQEARAAALLDHPNICTVYEIDEAAGQTFLAMPCLEGTTLRQKIAERPLRLDEALDIAIQIGQGLQAAHEKGVVHRDVKPANIMITPQGQVKIMDFGLAQLSDRTKLTAADTKLGTPAYMSPEQTEGKPADRRSDIWSLAVVLYEMVSGQAPFRAETGAAVARAILDDDPEPLTALRSGLPIELDRVLAKALGKKSGERYQHVDELIVDLRGIRKQIESGDKTGSIARPKSRKRARAYAWGAAAVVALVLLLAALLTTRRAAPDRSAWTQVTHFPDSATSPALSPDGRMLTFIRGASSFYGPGEIFVKMLPDGEPAQLTRDGLRKMSPVFSPDGSRIAYTVVDSNFAWDTWVVPVIGGEPKRWLPNASGLIWRDRQRLLFSEIKKGDHMALVTALENRTEARDLYVPPSERGMAHRSYLSPDGKWVLLSEMERSRWFPCRVIPADGSSPGRTVGPQGQCTHGAWSPDGEWVYMSSSVGGGFHIWRQRFPDGEPEQLTFGPTEEEGLALDPDGRWLLTAAGTRQSSLWVRDSKGDRELSSEGFAFLPVIPGQRSRPFSADGKRVYYLSRQRPAHFHAMGADVSGELWVAELDSGRVERWITGFEITTYDISPDQKSVVFAVMGDDGKSQVWIAPLDRRVPPRQLTTQGGGGPRWGPDGEIFFAGREGDLNFVYRINQDGTGLRKALEDPVFVFHSISPDGQWLVASVGVSSEEPGRQVVAFPVGGGSAVPICISCYINWTPDQRALHLVFTGMTRSGMGGARTVVVSLPEGKVFPTLPPGGIRSQADLDSLPGMRFSEAGLFYPSPDPTVYAYSRETVQRNIYRIPIP